METRRALIAALALAALLLAAPSVVVAATGVVVTTPKGSGSDQSSPGYAPDTVTVVMGVNNTVTWVNDDTVPHTVTPSSVPEAGSWSVGSGNMNPAQTYQFTFTVAGTYTYACAYHGWMRGTVIVKSDSVIPEFPTSLLAFILLLVLAAALLLPSRLKLGLPHLK